MPITIVPAMDRPAPLPRLLASDGGKPIEVAIKADDRGDLQALHVRHAQRVGEVAYRWRVDSQLQRALVRPLLRDSKTSQRAKPAQQPLDFRSGKVVQGA